MEISEIVNLCETFVRANIEFRSPDDVVGMCEYASVQFCKHFPELAAKLLHVKGYRHEFPNRHEYWFEHNNPDDSMYHVVVQIEDHIIVDLTYQQLDITWPTPYRIIPISEFKENWLAYSNKLECIDHLISYRDFITIRKAWIKDSHRTQDREFINRHRNHHRKLIIYCYQLIHKAIAEGDLTLTGTEQNNPYKRFLSRLKKFGIERCQIYDILLKDQ